MISAQPIEITNLFILSDVLGLWESPHDLFPGAIRLAARLWMPDYQDVVLSSGRLASTTLPLAKLWSFFLDCDIL